MSSAASTIPAKRNVFLTKKPKIPTLYDKPKNDAKAKHYTTKKATEKNHSGTDKMKDLDEDFKQKIEDEETWMRKTNQTLQRGMNSLGQPVAAKKKQKKLNIYDKPVEPTIKIMRVDQYDNFIEERNDLLQQNEKYGKRIEELELEIARIMGEFAKLYEDNEKLRSKMDTGKDPLIEPYSRVFEDRRILREAESGYKNRIVRLEKEITEKQNDCEKFRETIKKLKSKIKPTFKAEEHEKRTKQMKAEKNLQKVEIENETLKSKIKELEKEISNINSENEVLKTGIKRVEGQLKLKTKKMDSRKKLYQITINDEPVVFGY